MAKPMKILILHYPMIQFGIVVYTEGEFRNSCTVTCLFLIIAHFLFSYQDSEEKEFSSFVVQALKPAVCLVSYGYSTCISLEQHHKNQYG